MNNTLVMLKCKIYTIISIQSIRQFIPVNIDERQSKVDLHGIGLVSHRSDMSERIGVMFCNIMEQLFFCIHTKHVTVHSLLKTEMVSTLQS